MLTKLYRTELGIACLEVDKSVLEKIGFGQNLFSLLDALDQTLHIFIVPKTHAVQLRSQSVLLLVECPF